VVHRAQEEVVSHYCVEQKLEEHAVTDQAINEIQVTSLSEFWKEDVVVCPFHLHHCKQECEVPNHIVNNDTQHQDSGATKSRQKGNLILSTKDPSDSCHRVHQEICSSTGVGEQVGRQEDLVVTWNVGSQKSFEERGEDTLSNPAIEWIEPVKFAKGTVVDENIAMEQTKDMA
jgi:hypothetical protein